VALAPALGNGEAKRIIERRHDGRYLCSTPYTIESAATDHAPLLLRVDMHGAATLPRPLNDRTRNDWLPLTAESLQHLELLTAAGNAVTSAETALGRAKAAQRTLGAGARPPNRT
jgi:hypothetical protein